MRLLRCVSVVRYRDEDGVVPFAELAALLALDATKLALATSELAESWAEVSAFIADCMETLAC